MNDLSKENLKIIVVDDSDFSRAHIIKTLKDLGYTPSGEASSAGVALQIIREKTPHIVITDIVMPEISGIELTEKINQDFDDIYVIVISSLTQEHIVLDAIGAGAVDFISKPILPQQLNDSIEKIMSNILKDHT
jgi:two-component system chemotaxis response regulator CheY